MSELVDAAAIPVREWRRDGLVISTDRARVDRALVHRFLSVESYWARGVPFSVVDRSVDHSLNFGLYDDTRQLGYARAVTDYSTMAFVRDVFVVAQARGRGLGAWLVEALLEHPDLQGLRRVMLATRDAHGLYERYGFEPLKRVHNFLSIERSSKELYRP